MGKKKKWKKNEKIRIKNEQWARVIRGKMGEGPMRNSRRLGKKKGKGNGQRNQV